MKAIIENRVYDTETATLIASDDNGYPSCDFRHMEECLYQKKNGEYFIYGHGGAMSPYAVHHGNSITGSCGISRATVEQAKSWARYHMSVDAYIKHFGALT